MAITGATRYRIRRTGRLATTNPVTRENEDPQLSTLLTDRHQFASSCGPAAAHTAAASHRVSRQEQRSRRERNHVVEYALSKNGTRWRPRCSKCRPLHGMPMTERVRVKTRRTLLRPARRRTVVVTLRPTNHSGGQNAGMCRQDRPPDDRAGRAITNASSSPHPAPAVRVELILAAECDRDDRTNAVDRRSAEVL